MLETDLTTPKSRHLKILLQVSYWVMLLVIIGLLSMLAGKENLVYYLKWALISFPFKLAIFYGYFYYLIPKWLSRRTLPLIFITLLLFLLYPFLKYYVDMWTGIHSIQSILLSVDEDEESIKEYQVDLFQEWARRALTVFLNILTAFFFRFTVDWFKNLRIKSQLETQRLTSELAMLRNQVNPHFLFNTLNNIDAMVYKVSKEASEAIMKLSSIMRYMLYESNVDEVPLAKEIDYLESYFELQRMRIRDKKTIQFIHKVENQQLRIAPMLFIPFVENSFKHADFASQPMISCSLEQDQSTVLFSIRNSIPIESMKKDATGGIGLQNVMRRLELIYPKSHELKLSTENQLFTVTLKLTIDEN